MKEDIREKVRDEVKERLKSAPGMDVVACVREIQAKEAVGEENAKRICAARVRARARVEGVAEMRQARVLSVLTYGILVALGIVTIWTCIRVAIALGG